MTDDSELLRRYAEEKSETAFAELVGRHLDFVHAVALRQANGNTTIAEDVAQTVFTDLARKAGTLARHAVLIGWLHTATRFAVAKAIRSEVRRQAREQEAHAMNEAWQETTPAVDWVRLQPVLDDVLGELKEHERDAILLRFFEKKPLAEVGAKLALTEPAARSRVDRALDKMHALLARRGVTSTAGAIGLALASQTGIAAPAGLAASVTTAALAGAAASAGGAITVAAIFHLMSTTKIISGAAVAIAVVAIGTAIYQHSLVNTANAALAAAVGEREAWRTRVQGLETHVQQADAELTTARRELGERRAALTATSATMASARVASQTGPAVDYVLEHPEAQPLFVRHNVLRATARYERFLKDAGLSTEQQARFEKEIAEWMGGELDFMAALHSQGYGVGNLPQDPGLRQQLLAPAAEKRAAFQANLRALLGEELLRKFEEYGRAIPERNVTDQLAGQLYHTDSPLTAPQAEALAKLLAQHRYAAQPQPAPESTMNGIFVTARAMNGRVGQAMQQGGMNLLDWPAPVTDAALAQAATVLTPTQVAALKRLQAQQVLQIQLAPPPPGGDTARN